MRKRILTSISAIALMFSVLNIATVNVLAFDYSKPDIQGLGEEVSATIISSKGNDNTTGEGLFDDVIGHAPGDMMSWSTRFGGDETYYLEIEIPEKVNIWRCGTVHWFEWHDPLIIEKMENGTYIDVSSLYTQRLSKQGLGKWERTIKDLEPGTYRFTAKKGAARVDSEWYLEAVATSENEEFVLESVKNEYDKSDIIEVNLYDSNAKNLCATDVRITYDTSKLEYIGMTSTAGIDVLYEENILEDSLGGSTTKGAIRCILGIDGKEHIMNGKSKLGTLKFKAIDAGEAIVDITVARVADNGTYEKNIDEDHCGDIKFMINPVDVNKSGSFTLLDLAIDAYYKHMNVKDTDTTNYVADVVVNGKVDMDDLTEIVAQILKNDDYEANLTK